MALDEPVRALPPRLARALQAHARWRDDGINLVGIRHHSPGCAAALAALLDEVRPAVVLIEGPVSTTGCCLRWPTQVPDRR